MNTSVNFHVDEEVYKKYTLLVKLESKKIGETLAEYVKTYVRENESKLSGLSDDVKPPLTEPTLFAKPTDWQKFLWGLDPDTFKKYDQRFWLLRDLMQLKIVLSTNLIEDTVSYTPDLFYQSEDFEEIKKKYHTGILPNHKLSYSHFLSNYFVRDAWKTQD